MMTLYRIKALYLKLLRSSLLNRLFQNVFWPLLDILLMGMTGVWIQGTSASHSYITHAFLLSSVLWQIFISSFYSIASTTLDELYDRNFVNLFVSPLMLSEWITAGMLLSLTTAAFNLIFGGAAVYIIYGINLFSMGSKLIFFIVPLIVFGVAVGFMGAALIMFKGHQIEAIVYAMTWIFAPLCALYFPVYVLPRGLKFFAYCLPPTYVFESIRALLSTQQFSYTMLAIGTGLSVVFLVATLSFFCYAFEKSRERGLARLE